MWGEWFRNQKHCKEFDSFRNASVKVEMGDKWSPPTWWKYDKEDCWPTAFSQGLVGRYIEKNRILCGCLFSLRCQLGLVWLSLHNHFRVGQNRICPSPDLASLVGTFIVKYSKIIKTTWVSNDSYKSVAIVRALISLMHTPNLQAAEDNQGSVFSWLVSNCDCCYLFVLRKGFISVFSSLLHPHFPSWPWSERALWMLC